MPHVSIKDEKNTRRRVHGAFSEAFIAVAVDKAKKQ